MSETTNSKEIIMPESRESDSIDEIIEDESEIDESEYEDLSQVPKKVIINPNNQLHFYRVINLRFTYNKLKYDNYRMKSSGTADYLPPPCPLVDPNTVLSLPPLPAAFYYLPCSCFPIKQVDEYHKLLEKRETNRKKFLNSQRQCAVLQKKIDSNMHEEEKEIANTKINKKTKCPYKKEHLDELFKYDGPQKYLFKHQLRHYRGLPKQSDQYPAEVIKFSETLTKLSKDAYTFVNEAFNNALPSSLDIVKGKYIPPKVEADTEIQSAENSD